MKSEFIEKAKHILNLPSQPKVTALILTENGEKFIAKRLLSILNQSYKPFEVIIMDNASNDSTIPLAIHTLDRYQIPYKIVAIEDSLNLTSLLLKGLEHVHGDYLWITHQEDYCSLCLLKQLITPCRKNKNIVLSYCASQAKCSNGDVLKYYYDYRDDFHAYYETSGASEISHRLFAKNTIHSISSTLYKTQALKDLKKYAFPLQVSIEWFLNIFALNYGDLAYSPSPLNFHYIKFYDPSSYSVTAPYDCISEFDCFKDYFYIINFILDHFKLEEPQMISILTHISDQYKQFSKGSIIEEDETISPLYAELESKIYKLVQ